MTNCPLCQGKLVKVHDSFTGYVEGNHFAIWQCKRCQSQCIKPEKVDYDKIYQGEKYPWYEKFVSIAKNHPNPLQELAKQSAIYKPVLDFIKNQPKPLKILDVGCGYGYLVHSLRRISHEATGIDISSQAIKKAKHNFGNYFSISAKPTDKYDLIIATEVIEHVTGPREFIQELMQHLEPEGILLLTTPNKDFYSKLNPKAIWKTDLPPVHQTWISRQGIKLATKPFTVEFYSYPLLYTDSYYNLLLEARAARNNYTPVPKIRKDKTQNSMKTNVIKKIFKTRPGNYVSTLLARTAMQDYPVLNCTVKKDPPIKKSRIKL